MVVAWTDGRVDGLTDESTRVKLQSEFTFRLELAPPLVHPWRRARRVVSFEFLIGDENFTTLANEMEAGDQQLKFICTSWFIVNIKHACVYTIYIFSIFFHTAVM